MEEDALYISVGWLLVALVLGGSRTVPTGLQGRFPTVVGTFLLFYSWMFAPWLYLRPHETFVDLSIPFLQEFLPQMLQQLTSWLAGDKAGSALAHLLFVFNPPAYMLGVALPARALLLRALLLLLIPALFTTSFLRFSAELIMGQLWRRLSWIQVAGAAAVLVLLLAKLPEIDGWGKPQGIETGLLALVSAPQLGYGAWLAVQGLVLLLFGGLFEATSELAGRQTRNPRLSSRTIPRSVSPPRQRRR